MKPVYMTGRSIGIIPCLIFLLMITTGCDTILEYPEDRSMAPDIEAIRTRIELQADFSPVSDKSRSGDDGNLDVRYIIEVYGRGSRDSKPIERIVETDSGIPSGDERPYADVMLPPDEYDVYAWIDYVPSGTSGDYRYKTETLKKISLADPGTDGGDSLDAFAGKTSFDLRTRNENSGNGVTVKVDMERPSGKFIILSTDMDKYSLSVSNTSSEDVVPVETVCTYEGYFPTAYNADTRLAHTEEFKTGVSQKLPLTPYNDHAAVLAQNYVFVCNDNTNVTVNLEIRNGAGVPLSYVKSINIPIQRNRLTIVSGEFLTNGINCGETGINDSFEEEFIIVIP